MKRGIIRKIIGAVLIIAALIVYVIPSETIDADTASTTDFLLDGNKLVKYTGTASAVSIPATIKEIGEEAFLDNAYISSVVIPDSVERIGYAAFSGCNNLSKVTIPDSVETIDTAAFCNCSALSEVKIGSGLKKLGSGVFVGCQLLSEIKIGSSKFSCENSAIYNKDKTKLYGVLQGKKESAYSMPDTIEYILPYSFYGCENLNAVTVSPRVQDISAYSFSNCIGLKTVTIPYSVNNIDAKAFENCVNLTAVTVPESVTYIHGTAFDGCPRLEFDAPEFSYAANWFKKLDRSQAALIDYEENNPNGNTSYSLGDNSVSSNDPSNPNFETPIYEPANVPKNIEDLANSYVSGEGLIGETVVVGRRAVVFINNTKQTVVSDRVVSNDTSYSSLYPEGSELFDTETRGKGISLPKFAVIDNKIAAKAFYADTSLKEYEFDAGITEIGDFSFARSGLTSIVIPESVTSIGYGAFYHCDDLSKITIPSTVTNIEPAAFANTRMMDNWMQYGSGDYFICGDGILVAYRGGDSPIAIPEGVKQIGPEAFKDHKGITDVSLPDSLTRICEEAFMGCANLKTLSGGINLKVVEDRAFSGCPLDNVRVVASVEELGLGAFDLSNTVMSDDRKVAVFLGDSIPKVSYNATTSRLTNENFRTDALSGVKVAIVQNENISTKGSVLDKDLSGFSGIICVITEENNSYFNGRLKVIDSTLSATEAADFTVPNSLIIFGKGYNFDANNLESVLATAKSGAYEKDTSIKGTPVSFEGSGEVYDLTIADSPDGGNAVKASYNRIYGDTVPGNFYAFDISVKEPGNEVYLSKFGKQKLPVTMVLPSNIPTTNLHVICTDDDGQLEDLSYSILENAGKLCVRFDATHSGHYALYAFNSTAVSKYNLDDTPDTGDLVNPKLILAIGLLFAGLALILIKGKKKPLTA